MNAPKLTNSTLSTYGSCLLVLLFLLLTPQEGQSQPTALRAVTAPIVAAMHQAKLNLTHPHR